MKIYLFGCVLGAVFGVLATIIMYLLNLYVLNEQYQIESYWKGFISAYVVMFVTDKYLKIVNKNERSSTSL